MAYHQVQWPADLKGHFMIRVIRILLERKYYICVKMQFLFHTMYHVPATGFERDFRKLSFAQSARACIQTDKRLRNYAA